MTKNQRLLNVLMYINQKRKFTAKEIADTFSVSIRTVQRDLLELSEWGVPLYSEQGPHGGYTVLKNKLLPPLFFTEDEGVALYFSVLSLENYGDLPFSSDTQGAIQKLYFVLDENIRQRIDEMKKYVSFWSPFRDVKCPYLTDVLQYAINGHTITFMYGGSKGKMKKEIVPFGVYAQDGFWYCPAYDCLKQDIRLYRIDRMDEVESIGITEHPRMTLKEWFRTDSEGEMVPFRAVISKEGMRKIHNYFWLPPLVKLQEDGTGEVDTIIPLKEIRFTAEALSTFGATIKVEEPIELIKELCNRALSILSLYNVNDVENNS